MTWSCHINFDIIYNNVLYKKFILKGKIMMDEQNKTIEDKIKSVLSGDSLNNALDFIAFLQANGFSTETHGDGEGWAGAVGGIVGDSYGFMMANGAAEMPGPWTMWFNSCDFDGFDSIDDDLKEAVWAHASNCGKCHAGWKDCGGGAKTIFGREFEYLCHSPLMFTNPDAKTLENVKKLMLILKQKHAA